MATPQKVVIAALTCIAIGGILYQQHRIHAHVISALVSQVNEVRLERESRRVDSTIKQPAMSQADDNELLRLRGELARLRNQNSGSSFGAAVRAGDTNQNSQPHFQYGFISRDTWKNAGRAKPARAIETFFWAWTSKNEVELL